MIWRDEAEIRRAVVAPREEPIEVRNPVMCKFMTKSGRCDFKEKCKFAHSDRELQLWKAVTQSVKGMDSQ